MLFWFFFKQKTAYELRISDWSSDVCSSDLDSRRLLLRRAVVAQRLVRFVVFYLRSMILRHRPSPVIGCDSNGRRQCWFDPDDNCETKGDKRAVSSDRKSTRLNSSH